VGGLGVGQFPNENSSTAKIAKKKNGSRGAMEKKNTILVLCFSF